jgi:hypothetical protein
VCLKWQSACLASTKSLLQTPKLQKRKEKKTNKKGGVPATAAELAGLMEWRALCWRNKAQSQPEKAFVRVCGDLPCAGTTGHHLDLNKVVGPGPVSVAHHKQETALALHDRATDVQWRIHFWNRDRPKVTHCSGQL